MMGHPVRSVRNGVGGWGGAWRRHVDDPCDSHVRTALIAASFLDNAGLQQGRE